MSFLACEKYRHDAGWLITPGKSMEALDNVDTMLREIESAPSLDALDTLRVALLGKNGAITAALKSLGSLPADERKARGAEVNKLKDRLADALAARKSSLEQAELDRRLASERLDVTLPGRDGTRGGIHPITRAKISAMRSSARVIGWIPPRVPSRPGRVTSSR